MPQRIIPALFVAAALAYACSPRSHTAEPKRQNAAAGPPVAASLNVKVNSEVAFVFHITNNATKRLELTFPTGQTHDIVVLDSIGREVWRWSAGRMFTQAFQNKVVEAHQTVTYEATWKPDRRPGKYTAIASLMSQNHPVEERLEFALP